MADNDPIIRRMQAERAYGPIYSSQFADAMKSARANEMARRWNMPPDIVEETMPDLLAAERVNKRLDAVNRSPSFARMMTSPRLAASSADDDHLPKVAEKLDQHIEFLSPTWWGMGAANLVGGVVQMFGGAAKAVQGIGEASTQVRKERSGLGIFDKLPDPLEVLAPIGRSLADLPDRLQPALSPKTGNHLTDTVMSGFQSAGSSIGALAIALGTRSPAAGAVSMGVSTGGQSYQSGRDEGLDPRHALNYAAGDAAIETGTELIPMGWLTKAIGEGKGVLKTIGGDFLREMPSELVATTFQELNRWVNVEAPKGVPFEQYLKELPEELRDTAIATLVTVGIVGSGGYAAGRHIQTKMDQHAAVRVGKVMEAAAESSTRTSNPSDFEEALNQLVQDTAAENLYVPAEQVDALFKDAPEKLAEHPFWSQFKQQLDQARALGGDITVPLASAATHLAGTPEWEALKDHVRVSAKGVSIAEAKDRASPKELERLASQIGAMVTDAVPRLQRAQALTAVKDIAAGLGYAGSQADAISRYIASAVVTRYNEAAASGQDVGTIEQFAKDWLPQVQKMTQAEYERGGAGVGATMEQGDRPVVYHGTSAQFNEFMPLSHFGSRDAALDRLRALRGDPEDYDAAPLPGERIIEARLNITNPLSIIDRGQDTLIDDMIDDAVRAKAITQAEAKTLKGRDSLDDFIALLSDRGYDGFVYDNAAEDIGSKSWMPFRSDQVEVIDEGRPYDQSTQGLGGDNAAAGSVRDGRGLPGSPELLAAEARAELGLDEPLPGAPQSLTIPGRGKVPVGRFRKAMQAAASYMASANLHYSPPTAHAKVDVERATRIANEFEAMEHAPNDPTVKAAYDAMIAETLAQWQAIKETGLEVEFIKEGMDDPYAASPRMAVMDVIENNHLWVFPTTGGFGQGEVSDSPMLQETDEFVDGRYLLANDVFRIVHDYFGHIKDGHGFRAEGEENAWQSHAAMYTPLARRAMTTETRGQNSWLNYGPHGESNRSASSEATLFAPQKVALMPEWTSEEGMLAAPNSGHKRVFHGTPHEFDTFADNGRAVWFSEGPQLASRYANARRFRKISGDQIIPATIQFENPLNLDPYIPANDYVENPVEWAKQFGLDLKAAGWEGIGGYRTSDIFRTKSFANAARAAGYDALGVTESQTQTWGVLGKGKVTSTLTGQTLNQTVDPPGFARVAPFLTEDEKKGMRLQSKEKLLGLLEDLPDPEEVAAVAVAGRAKKGWYARSAQAIVDVFGLNDAPRFAALLASMSPQTSVEGNLYNALKTWTNWNEAGRPTDRKTIVEIMGRSVMGNKGSASVLNAWINNSVAALSDANPASLKLSGAKVNSFMANLVGVVDEVTNDTWMARYAGLSAMSTGGRSDKTNLYKAMNAVVRQAATIATERTGETWEPMEVQETVWSFAKTLYEMAQSDPEGRLTQELLDAAELTHANIADTVDFATLFSDGIFRLILEEGGYGDAVASLDSSGRSAQFNGSAEPVTNAEGTGFAPDDFKQFLSQAAARFGRELELRRARTDSRQGELTLNQAVSPSEEVFYSNAERAVENAKMEKASADQWIALLTPGRTPGIKAEEIEWTGVIDWLKVQKGAVTKDALLQLLRDRGIKVEEVVNHRPNLQAVYENDAFNVIDQITGESRGIFKNMDDAREFIEIAYRNNDNVQFSSWSSDPNNPTYRELLITLPLGQGSNPDRAPGTHWDTEAVVAHLRFMEKADAEGKRVLFIEEVQSDWHQKGRDEGYDTKRNPAEVMKLREEYDAALEKSLQAQDDAIALTNEIAGHNLVSTWLMAQRNLEMHLHRLIKSDEFDPLGGNPDPAIPPEDLALATRINDALDAVKDAALKQREAEIAWNGKQNGIPEAPFKTSWPALVMKRAIRWAVDNGFERVAWTTGEEQASRYNLSSATGPIGIQKIEGGKFGEYAVMISRDAADQLVRNGLAHRTPEAMSIDGGMVEMSAAELKEAFGQDVTNRLLAGMEEFEANKPKLLAEIDAMEADLKARGAARKAKFEKLKEEANQALRAEGIPGERADEQVKKLSIQSLAVAAGYDPDTVRAQFEDMDLPILQGPTDIYQKRKGLERFTLDGEGLNVGGEGMKAFYDRNLVNITNDIIKKYGAKVGKVAIHQKGHSEMGVYQTHSGQWWYSNWRGPSKEHFATREEAQAALDASQERGDPHPGFEITPQLAEAAGSGFALFQQKRGNISIRPGQDGLMQGALIRAFESANFSTAIHELGHFFLEDLKRRALGSNGTDQARADWEAFKRWSLELGIEVKDNAPIPVDAHEYFARGMERFAWEGSAPSRGLRVIFTKLREFMLDLYKTATSFNAPITPEIRQVMGRMLAAQEEIEAQERELAAARGEIKGLLSEAEQAAYDALGIEAKHDAQDKLYARILSALRAEKMAAYRDQREELRRNAAQEIDQQPIYQALRMIRAGIPGQDGNVIRARLPRQWLLDNYGPEVIDQLPRSVPPIVTDKPEDAIDPEVLAGMAGFSSSDEMIRKMVELEAERKQMKDEGDARSPRMKALESAVSNRMAEEIGDPLANLEEEAQAALQNDRQAELMSMELRALARKTGRKPTAWRLAVEWARERVRIASTKDATTGTAIQMYARNVTKAQKAAEEALIAGKFDEAFQFKQQQLLNAALLSEAKKARDEVDAAVKRMQKIAKRNTMPSVDQDYLEQAHALLEDVDLKDRSGTQVAKREAFAAWHAQQIAQGIDPIVPASYREALGSTHWTKLGINELLELDKLVSQVVELGRLKQRLKDGKEQRDFNEAVEEMRETALQQKARKTGSTTDEARNFPARVRSALRSADAAMIKVEQLCRWLDGDNVNGPWTRMIFNVMAEAGGREQDMLRTYTHEINAIIKGLPKTMVKALTRTVDTPELIIRNPEHINNGQPFRGTKDQVVMMAMNWGNEGNRQRLLDGFGWQDHEVEAVLQRLMTKEDWDFVQQVWDQVDKLWPEVEQLERRVNGIAPEKIEAVPVQTPHGTYRGGYFPVAYDPTQSTRSAVFEDDKLSPQGGLMQVVTRSSATKARAEAVKGRPLLLSMGVITRHLGEVIHDVTHREAVSQVRRLLTEARVHSAINTRLGPEYAKAFAAWLENIATPNVAFSKSSPAEVAIGRHLNKGISMVGLGFRFSTGLMQLLGLPSVISEIGSKHMAYGIAVASAHPIRTYREIVARSAEMRSRFDTLDASIEDMVAQASGGKLEVIGPKGIAKYAFHGILYMDMVVTTAAWTGAFNKGMVEGMTEEEATAFADKVIRTTQGSGSMKDRSRILNAHPVVRSFYPFFSYLNALFNMQRDVVHRAAVGVGKMGAPTMANRSQNIEGVKDVAEAARRAWWVAIVPMLLQALIFGDGPDDDEGTPDGWAWANYLVKSVALGNLGSLPLIGNLANAIGNGYGYRTSAYQQVGEGMVKGYKQAADIVTDDKPLTGATIKSTLNTAGMIFAKPLGQIGATSQGVYDYARGEAQPTDAGDWYELLTKGRISKQPTAAERLLGEK